MFRVIAALTATAEIYGVEMTPARMNGYTAALAEYNPDDVVSAIKETVKSCDFFPKPSQIIKSIKAISNKQMMIEQLDDSDFTEHDRDEVTELLTDFKKRMKWD